MDIVIVAGAFTLSLLGAIGIAVDQHLRKHWLTPSNEPANLLRMLRLLRNGESVIKTVGTLPVRTPTVRDAPPPTAVRTLNVRRRRQEPPRQEVPPPIETKRPMEYDFQGDAAACML